MARRQLQRLRADLTVRDGQFTAEVTPWAVRWCLMVPISHLDRELVRSDRSVAIPHTTIFRGIGAYARALEKRRPHLCRSDGSQRADDTCVRVKGR